MEIFNIFSRRTKGDFGAFEKPDSEALFGPGTALAKAASKALKRDEIWLGPHRGSGFLIEHDPSGRARGILFGKPRL
jgi:hypothetical protein